MKRIVEQHTEEIKQLRAALLRTQAELLRLSGRVDFLEKENVKQDTAA